MITEVSPWQILYLLMQTMRCGSWHYFDKILFTGSTMSFHSQQSNITWMETWFSYLFICCWLQGAVVKLAVMFYLSGGLQIVEPLLIPKYDMLTTKVVLSALFFMLHWEQLLSVYCLSYIAKVLKISYFIQFCISLCQ